MTANGFADAVGRASAFTLGVYARRERADTSPEEMELLEATRIGSGFLVDDSGVAFTAAHLLTDSDLVVVRAADGRITRAELLAVDPDLDVAVLRIPRGWARLPRFGSERVLRPGDWVLAIGEPFGLGRSVTAGIVSGVERHFMEDERATFIQSDVAVNAGNSGGPLVDADGVVVGMNVRLLAPEVAGSNVTLSLPIDLVLDAARALMTTDRATHYRLQAEFGDVSPMLALARHRADTSGAFVYLVEPGGNAHRAGLRTGDVVVAIDASPVLGGADLARQLHAMRKGRAARMTVLRGERRLVIDLSSEHDRLAEQQHRRTP